MASTSHLELSDFIKSVHQNLRETSKKVGSEEAWRNHCTDEANLRKYAEAMQKLACQFWEPNSNSVSKSRIKWTVDACLNYFTKDIKQFRCKEKDISEKLNCSTDISNFCYLLNARKLKLLDVGSCYNPFNELEEFAVTAIDIAPATDEVIKCDFLNVSVEGTEFISDNNELQMLPKTYFDIVVFSLLLEYLPSPNQRRICCEKAYDLLKTEGILIIITPDSNHVGINAKFMKSWRYILAKMGFSRIKYEKFLHIHCMMFRKSIDRRIASRWAELHKNEQFFEEIYIPQDFNSSNKDTNEQSACTSYSKENSAFIDCDLPEADIFQ